MRKKSHKSRRKTLQKSETLPSKASFNKLEREAESVNRKLLTLVSKREDLEGKISNLLPGQPFTGKTRELLELRLGRVVTKSVLLGRKFTFLKNRMRKLNNQHQLISQKRYGDDDSPLN